MLTGFAVVIMVVLGIALTSLTAPRPLNEYVVDGVSKVMTELESQRSELMKAPTAKRRRCTVSS